MMNATTISSIPPAASIETAWQDVRSSFERFCLTAGVAALEQMLHEDAERPALGRDQGEDRLPWRQGWSAPSASA